MVEHTCKPRTWEAKMKKIPSSSSQPRLHVRDLSPKTQNQSNQLTKQTHRGRSAGCGHQRAEFHTTWSLCCHHLVLRDSVMSRHGLSPLYSCSQGSGDCVSGQTMDLRTTVCHSLSPCTCSLSPSVLKQNGSACDTCLFPSDPSGLRVRVRVSCPHWLPFWG